MTTSTTTLLAIAAVLVVLLVLLDATREGFEAANERPVYWRM